MDPQTQERPLLAFARKLQSASDYAELVALTRDEIRERVGYQSAWMFVFEDEDLSTCRLWAMSGAQAEAASVTAQVLRTDADPMVAEIVREQTVQVIPDARIDPRTDKAIVEALGNRTIINIPLRLLEEPLGVLGMGTFGEEGVRVPTDAELDTIERIASHLSVAAGRLQMLDAERARQAELAARTEQLARAKRLESLGLMASGVAHDFNNLLTVISLTAESMARDELTQRQSASLNRMREACSRAQSLAAQLLAVGRDNQPVSERLDIEARLGSLTRILGPAMGEAVELVYRPRGGLPAVYGDAGQLDQVFTNLCFNARDASPDGGLVYIEVNTIELHDADVVGHPWMRPGGFVRVTVRDGGVGMPPDVAERAFEPFFTTKEPGEGTGLGLAMAYSLTRQHGGRLQLATRQGEGTAVSVDLPTA